MNSHPHRVRSLVLALAMLGAGSANAGEPGGASALKLVRDGGEVSLHTGKPGPGLRHQSRLVKATQLFPGQGIAQLTAGAVHQDADMDGLLDAGETIDFSYTLVNLGDVALSGLALNDLAGAVSCPQTTLAVDAHMVCTRSYAIDAQNAADGGVINEVEALGQDAAANAVQSFDLVLVQNLGGSAGLRVFKSPRVLNDADADQLVTTGDLMRYDFVVRNSGGEALTAVGLSEPDPSRIDTPITCAATSLGGQAFAGNGTGQLASGDTVLCSAEYTVRDADETLGQVLNLVEASATAPIAGLLNATASSAVTAGVPPPGTLLLDKAIVSGDPYLQAGDVIEYSYTVTNTGPILLAGPVTVSDDRVAVTCPALTTIGNNDADFDVGEVVVCSASYVVTETDVSDGSVTNTAQAFADGVASNIDTATAMGPEAVPVPVIGVSKRVDALSGRNPYQLRYEILVRNYGVVPLTQLQVEEDLRATFPLPVQFQVTAVAVSGTAAANPGFDGEADTNLLDPTLSTLAVDAEVRILLSLDVLPGNERGPFLNSVIASGRGPNDVVVSDASVSETVPDPDGNGIPDEADPTPVIFPGGLPPAIPAPSMIPVANMPVLVLLALLLASLGWRALVRR